MSFSPSRPTSVQFEQAFAPFLNDPGLPFAQVLPAAEIEQAFTEAGVHFGASQRSVFTPALAMWAWLSQVVDPAKSCAAAVLRVSALLLALGRGPCSQDTAAYCRARAKLPAMVLRKLALQVGQRLEEAVPKDWLWQQRPTQLVDGTTVTLADTPENQEAFPQPTGQRPGLGFPMIRMVVLLSLATAAVTGMAYGPCLGKETGEAALLRQLLDDVAAGTVLVADRYYCSYWLVAMALGRKLDVVFRLHHRRGYDFRTGWQLGRNQHVAIWCRPKRPEWMDPTTYEAIPKYMHVREIRYTVTTPGFRTRQLIVVTTLLEATEYPLEVIADLYHQRWHVELDIRAIKQSLQMEHLRCQTPFMIQKEIWMHMLGYNLVRKVAAQAAQERGVHPRDVSFTAARDAVNASRSQWTLATSIDRVWQGKKVLENVGKARVGHRPDRCEPRARKRRPRDEYPLLCRPRTVVRAELLAGVGA